MIVTFYLKPRAKQKIRSPEPPQFVDSQWVVAVKGGNSTVYLNEQIGKVTIKWNGGSRTTSREC